MDVVYEIDDAEVLEILNRTPERVEDGTVRAVDKTLDTIEKAQILAYTSSSNPSQPSGSTYTRTFTLQASSFREITRRRWPVEGKWWSEGVDYARYVIGTPQQQAAIHAGRWKDLNEVAREGQKALDEFMGAEIRRIKGLT